jgi:hypothetical protein
LLSARHTAGSHDIQMPFNSLFTGYLFMLKANQALILSVALLPSGCAVLF